MGTDQKFGRTAAEWDEIVSRGLSILEETARNRSLIPYSELAERITRDVGPTPLVDHHLELSHVLYDVVLLGLERWPDRSTAPLISALAVYKDIKEPARGQSRLQSSSAGDRATARMPSSSSGGKRLKPSMPTTPRSDSTHKNPTRRRKLMLNDAR